MEKKLVVFDIDGTLITDDHAIPDETIAAIQALKEAGHMVMCATGRSFVNAKDVLDQSGITDYILNNGAVAFVSGKQVYNNPLDRDELENLVQVCDDNNIDLVFNSLDATKLRNEQYQPETKIAMESFGQPLPKVERDFYQNTTIYQVIALLNEKKMPCLEGKFPHFRLVRWHEEGIDVLPKNGSKAETLKWIANEYGFDKKDIIAFGDGNNDMEMIQYVGVGIAMANSKKELKKVSDFVTLSNNEGGICHGLREYGLI